MSEAKVPVTTGHVTRNTPLLRQRRDFRRAYYQRINVISSAMEPKFVRPKKMSVTDDFFEMDPEFRPLSPADKTEGDIRDVELPDVAGQEEEEEGLVKISLMKSVFNLTNTTVGAGTLAMPYYVAQTGFVLGFGLLSLVAAMSDFALWLLLVCGESTGTSSYFDVARKAYGRAGG